MHRNDFIKLLALSPFSFPKMKLNHLNLFQEKTPKMPILFIGHGSPMNAIEDNNFVKQWKLIAKNLPPPKAILCISAHWETKGTFVTAMPNPKTIHDFGGFPQALFDVQYPAPGNAVLASEISQLGDSFTINEDTNWGLDHGCWSVLNQMYPNADIPVLQLSLDYTLSAQHHMDMAAQLSVLRERGVLIIGSGNMVHNLALIDWRNPDGGFDWAVESNEAFKKMILESDVEMLSAKKPWNNALKLAVPSTEHYNPLLYIMGIKSKNEIPEFFNDQTVMGSISMTSVMFKS
jgi:4,5-DOPA dioxygenase extradiol